MNSSAVAAFSLAAVFAAHAGGQLNVLVTMVTEYGNETGKYSKGVQFNENRRDRGAPSAGFKVSFQIFCGSFAGELL